MTIRWLFFVLLLAAPAAWSDTVPPQGPGGRAELWLMVTHWPSLGQVSPELGGRFDTVGFGLGGALYLTVRELATSDLLVGIDGFIAANDSNVRGVFDDLLARQFYLGAAAKWAFGEERSVSLDAGIGYHLVDMAEVGDAWSSYEREAWETDRASAYLGATWDLPSASLGSPGRWMLGVKVYFTDFGTVNGFWPIGPDAGKLDGPLYTMQIGYGVR
jgi:hypothetical protein